jgi:hypothetical protein
LEALIARLAGEGLSNLEIGARLFLTAHGQIQPGQGVCQGGEKVSR